MKNPEPAIPTEAIEAGARALSPHLFDGRHEAAMRNMPNLFTPEQAAESAEAKRNERLGDVELILTAAAPHIRAAALRDSAEVFATGEWADAFIAGNVTDDVSAVKATDKWLNDRANNLEGKTE